MDAKLDLGERVVAFMKETYGVDRAEAELAKVAKRLATQPLGGSQPNRIEAPSQDAPRDVHDLVDVDEPIGLPYGFWRSFVEEELRSEFNNRRKMQMIRSLEMYVLGRGRGANTRAALRGFRRPRSHRSDGGALNHRKAAGLGFCLLQFFVGDVQRIMCRAD